MRRHERVCKLQSLFGKTTSRQTARQGYGQLPHCNKRADGGRNLHSLRVGDCSSQTSFASSTLASCLEQSEIVALHFSVRDTDVGIPKEKLSVIFEAFSQADG